MSLPDTIFIFVLALIIFGPKKLPEIGRQIGKLVGEFRRASNEFKFQIEEELRQADWNEKKAERQTIAPPKEISSTADNLAITDALPAGQRPNIDALEARTLHETDGAASEPMLAPAGARSPVENELVVAAAAGSEPRTNVPFVNNGSAAHLPLFDSAEECVTVAANSTSTAESELSIEQEERTLAASTPGAEINHG